LIINGRKTDNTKKNDYRTNNIVVRFEWDGRLCNDNIKLKKQQHKK
jgi:hypothetical protein